MIKIKKNKRNFLAIGLLIACTMLATIFATAFTTSKSASAATPLSAFKFTQISSSGYSIAAQNKTLTRYDIPDEYDDLPIIEIANNGFASCPNMKMVVIPPSVKKLGTGAFLNCGNLEKVYMAGVEIIGQNAFSMCAKLDNLVLPATVTTVGASILVNNTKTVISRVPQNVANNWVGWKNSFSGNVIYSDELENCAPIFESGVKVGYSVGFQGFGDDTLDLYIDEYDNLPILEIENFAFMGTTLESVAVGLYSSHPINVKSYAFFYSNIQAIGFDDNVTFDDELSFEYDNKSNNIFYSSSVTQVVLPDSLDSILPSMFQECGSLESISFASNQSEINILSSNIVEIYDDAFTSCELPYLFVPSSVERMGNSVFNGWSANNGQGIYIDLTEAEVEALEELWDSNPQEGWHPYWDSGCDPSIITYKQQPYYTPGLAFSLLPNGTYSVSKGTTPNAFQIIIPETYNGKNVTELAANAFSNFYNLMLITIPNTVTRIGDYAFSGCTNLSWVDLPYSVTSVGTGVFNNSGIDNINANNSIIFVSGWAVGYKGTLTGNLPLYLGMIGIADFAFYGCTGITNIAIPFSVRYIGARAIVNCTAAITIAMPNTNNYLINIGEGAFWGCNNLTNVFIPKTVKNIDARAFVLCKNLTSVVFETDNQIETIGDSAFSSTGLTSIVIPDSIRKIGVAAFDADSLKIVSIPYADKNINSAGNFSAIFGAASGSINTVIIRGGDKIGGDMFNLYFSGLTKVIISDSITTIENNAFSCCQNLTSIVIPASVETIEAGAFSYCYSLTYYVEGKTSAPIGWDYSWDWGCPVIWGCTLSVDGTYVESFVKTSTSVSNIYSLTINAPQRAGYAFLCWNTAANGSGTSYAAANVASAPNNTTLYAIWN